MDEKLLKAILSMDSYNRNYNAGVDLRPKDSNGNLILNEDGNPVESDAISTQIGNFQIIKSSTNDGQDIGFYALAYQNTNTSGPGAGETIIAYRGTDEKIQLGADD